MPIEDRVQAVIATGSSEPWASRNTMSTAMLRSRTNDASFRVRVPICACFGSPCEFDAATCARKLSDYGWHDNPVGLVLPFSQPFRWHFPIIGVSAFDPEPVDGRVAEFDALDILGALVTE